MKKFKDIDVSDAIDVLKKRIEENRISLLVGAGASRCACDLYTDWYGLLKDMVAFLYADELQAKGLRITKDERFYCHYKIEKAEKLSCADVDEVINGIINRVGVLRIPSLFEKRTGLRESVEAYIESHIPRLDRARNTVDLFGESVELDSRIDFLASMLDAGWNSIFTTNYDNLLEYAARQNGITRFEEYSNASDLSLRKMSEMIIKLHGSINSDSNTVGFDGDKHRKYVITQEDYDDYPVRHEAFMQLMRISLLKDCLCMVGFSGKDANFIAWINWVREIIVESTCDNVPGYPDAEDIKVFFIDVMGGELDDATQLFFENHRIYRILLTKDIVREKLGVELIDGKDNETRAGLFKAFFEYIRPGIIVNQSQTVCGKEDIVVQSEKQQGLAAKSMSVEKALSSDGDNKEKTGFVLQDAFSLWSKAYKYTGKSFLNVEIDERVANQLINRDSYLRLMRGTYCQSDFIDAMERKNELDNLEAKLSLMALEQMQDDYDDEDFINKISNALHDEADIERAGRLINRHVTLVSPCTAIGGNSDMVLYEQCARFAFTFDFVRLKEVLNSWNPSPDFMMKKLIFLNLVDSKAVGGILSQSLLDKIHPLVERFRATQLANILSGGISKPYSVNEFTDLSQHSIYSLCDWYFGNLIQPKEWIHAYGSGDEENKGIDIEKAVRCLNFMLETPIMPQIGLWSIVSNVQWYKVAHALFEKYPYPVLFYSSTLNDRNTLKRIGQDFAYSKSLHDSLPEFTVKMFRMITNKAQPVSNWISHNICCLLCEMIKAVPSSYWDDYILTLWKDCYLPQFEETFRSNAISKLICSGLSCTTDEDLAVAVINDCLKLVKENGKYHLVQDLFYYLRTKYSSKVAIAIKDALSEFVSKIDNGKDFILLGNLNKVIGKMQYKDIARKIPSVISSSGIEESSINGLIYYAKFDKDALSIVKQALLASDSLWNNGIMEDESFGRADYIPIVQLDNFLKWTDDEVHAVYGKLKKSAEQLFDILGDDVADSIMNYDGLLNEMLQFIDLHRAGLADVQGLDALYAELDEKYKLLTGYVDIDKSVFSDNDDEVEACLDALAVKVRKDGISRHIPQINVLVTRLLCRNKNSYQEVLNYMQYYVRYYIRKKDLGRIPQISLLMDKLTLDEFRNLEQNVIFCAELSILMAERLQKLGMDCAGVDYWMKLKKERYFNWTICENAE